MKPGRVTLLGVGLVGGAALLIACLLVVWRLNRGDPARPDLVLITIDTLRADRLELYGSERKTAPALAALGRAGMTYEHAISQAPWTLPAMASIHTSLYPSQHRAILANRRLGPKTVMLAEVLAQNGYETAAVISHLFTSRRFGFEQGFSRFNEKWIADRQAITSEQVTRDALASYEVSSEAPRFLWVHYFDPHYSYMRHPEYGYADGYQGRLTEEVSYDDLGGLEGVQPGQIPEADARYARDVYDEEIRYTDLWIGRLIEGLRAAAGDRPVVFLVSADHGEYFSERGRFGHGKDVYHELVHVPLIIAGDHPAISPGSRVGTYVETASIAATMMELAGIGDHPFRGESLLRIAADGARQSAVFTEGNYAWGNEHRKRAVIVEPWKLIRNFDDGSLELYHLGNDPGELLDQREDPRAGPILERLAALLRRFEERKREGTFDRIEVSDEERSHLDSLGYTSSGK